MLEPCPRGSPCFRLAWRLAGLPRVAAALVLVSGFVVVATAGMVIAGLAITHLAVHGSVGQWDRNASRWLAERRRPSLNLATELATRLADTTGIVVVAVAAVAFHVGRRRWREALLVVAALTIELSVFLVTTFAVGRPRPAVARLNDTPVTWSFPSGHTAATFALYGSLAVIVTAGGARRAGRVGCWILVALLTGFVGFARDYRGMHHTSDVVAGALLGAIALVAAVLTVRTLATLDACRLEREGR